MNETVYLSVLDTITEVDISANDISCNNLSSSVNIVSEATISCTDFASVTCDSENLTSIDCTISNDLSANQVYAVQSVDLGSLGPMLISQGTHTWIGLDGFGSNPLVFSNLDGDIHKVYKLIIYGFTTFTTVNGRFTINYNGVVLGPDYNVNTSSDGSFSNYTNTDFVRLIEPNRTNDANLFSESYIKADRQHSQEFLSQSKFFMANTGAGITGTADGHYENTANNNMTSFQVDVSNTLHGTIDISYRLMRYY